MPDVPSASGRSPYFYGKEDTHYGVGYFNAGSFEPRETFCGVVTDNYIAGVVVDQACVFFENELETNPKITCTACVLLKFATGQNE